MDLTIADVIAESRNTYEKGLDDAPKFYTKSIPEERYKEIVTSKDLFSGKVVEAFLEVASKISNISLIVIPCVFSPYGGFGLFSISLLTGSCLALLEKKNSYLTSEEEKNDYFKSIKERAQLYACLSSENKNRYLGMRVTQIAFNSILHGLVGYAGFYQNSFVGTFATIYFGCKFGSQIVSLAIGSVLSASQNLQNQKLVEVK